MGGSGSPGCLGVPRAGGTAAACLRAPALARSPSPQSRAPPSPSEAHNSHYDGCAGTNADSIISVVQAMSLLLSK